ncbi:hypothetical protein [Hymenobacter arcticus]
MLSMPMVREFELTILNQRKGLRVLWGYIGYVGLLITLLGTHHTDAVFGLLCLLPIGLGILLRFRDKLVGEDGRVRIDADGLELTNQKTGVQITLLFKQLHSYRILPAKGSMGLLLRTKNEEKLSFSASYTTEFADMIKAFEQALRQYNQTENMTPILREKGFFERVISTKVLLSLFALATVLIAWGFSAAVSPIKYVLPVVLVVLPYLSVWAMFSDKRE